METQQLAVCVCVCASKNISLTAPVETRFFYLIPPYILVIIVLRFQNEIHFLLSKKLSSLENRKRD